MKTAPMSRIGFRMLRSALDMFRDRSGIAATEFAVIVPIMLVMFFGVVEFSSGVAVDRKVTLVARTMSDLTSQVPSSAPQATYAALTDTYLQNVFNAGISIFHAVFADDAHKCHGFGDLYRLQRYRDDSMEQVCDSSERRQQATLTTSSRNPGDTVTSLVPSALLVKKTYLIWSEVSYLYTPAVGYVMAKTGVT